MVDETVLNEAEGSFDDPIDLENADFGDAPEGEVQAGAAAEPAAGEGEPAPAADDEGAPEGLAKSTDEGEGPDAEAEGEAAAEVDEPPAQREPMLPKHRYDSVRRQLREVEAELEKERQAKADAAEKGEVEEPAGRDFDGELTALNEKFTQALLDADAKTAASLNQEMLTLQQEKLQTIIDAGREGVISESRDSVLTDTLVDELVATNARLNPDSDKFDQPLVTRLNSMRKYYERDEGLTESQALVKTIEVLMPDAFESQSPRAADGGKKLADKIAAANRQPPNANQVGEDGPELGQGEELVASKLRLEDLDKVTDAQWDKMLGNNL